MLVKQMLDEWLSYYRNMQIKEQQNMRFQMKEEDEDDDDDDDEIDEEDEEETDDNEQHGECIVQVDS